MLEDVFYTDRALTTPLYCKEESAQTEEHDTVWHELFQNNGEGTEHNSSAQGEKWNKIIISPFPL